MKLRHPIVRSAMAAPCVIASLCSAQAGLHAEWYWERSRIRGLAGVDWNTPDLQTTEDQIAWNSTRAAWFPAAPRDRFAVRLTGSLRIPTTGDWTLFLHSDDGSDLWIDGERVVDNDGDHGMRLRSGRVNLAAGVHDITVRYYENGGGAGLIASWQGPGMSSRQVIPPSAFVGSGVGGALEDSGLDGPITAASQWRAATDGPREWFGRDFVTSGGAASLTHASNNWQGRVLLQAVPMPLAGTFRYELKTGYDDYHTQLHYWHLLGATDDAVIRLDYPSVSWDFRNSNAESLHRRYSLDGQEGDPWHVFEEEFTVSPSMAERYDYLVFALVGSMRSGQSVKVDSVLLDLSRFHDGNDGRGFASMTTDSSTHASAPVCNDLNGDGLPDVLLTGRWPKLMLQGPDKSFAAAPFAFSDLHRQSGVADYDNDGDLDLWVAGSTGRNNLSLFWNEGDGGFSPNSPPASGLRASNNNDGIMVADTDGDGWCDIVLCSTSGNLIGRNIGLDEELGQWMFRQLDDEDTGINGVGAAGNGDFISSGDINNDGYPDFFYHYRGGRLFLSESDGSYLEQVGAITVTTGQNDRSGSAWADYDNDGDLDLFVARLDAGQPCYLFRQDPGGSFTDVASGAGITTTAGHRSGCWGDWDNDGDLDLVVLGANGAPHLLYLNQGDGTFVVDDTAIPVSGDGSDAVFADYDNDGDLDLIITHIGTHAVLLENSTDTDRYLKVRVVGAGAGGTNAAGVGVRVELYSPAGELVGRRDIGAMRGYGGQDPLWAHFGGVDPAVPYTLVVHFASGQTSQSVVPALARTTIGATTIEQMVTVTEPAPTGLRLIQWQETDPSQ